MLVLETGNASVVLRRAAANVLRYRDDLSVEPLGARGRRQIEPAHVDLRRDGGGAEMPASFRLGGNRCLREQQRRNDGRGHYGQQASSLRIHRLISFVKLSW